MVRASYEYKCAILGDNDDLSIISNETDLLKYTSLEAAHLWPDTWGGPLRPDNGMLLNPNMHWAFDCGLFTIDEEYRVKMHDSLKNKPIYKYNLKKINLPQNPEHHPKQDYLNIHRKFVFGRLKPLAQDIPVGLSQYLKEIFNKASLKLFENWFC